MKKGFSGINAQQFALLRINKLPSVGHFNHKASLSQSILQIHAVEPDMIILIVQPLTLARVGNRGVFERRLSLNRHLDQSPTARFQDPKDFLHRFPILRHMLQNMTA